MKKILILLYALFAAETLCAGEASVHMRNVNDDFAGLISDDYTDVLMNPAEIAGTEGTKFYGGISNLPSLEDREISPYFRSISAPLAGIMCESKSSDFKHLWIGSLYNQHNSHRYGLNGFDDINPNLAGIQQGSSWEHERTFYEGSTRVQESSSTVHYLDTQVTNLGGIYGWKMKEKSDFGIMLKYAGESFQEPNIKLFNVQKSTALLIYRGEDAIENNRSLNSNSFSVIAGFKKEISPAERLGLTAGLSYIFRNTVSRGKKTLYRNYMRTGDDTKSNYIYEECSSSLDDDNDTRTDEDGCDGTAGNLPGIDDDWDGRVDEDPGNTSESRKGAGLPLSLTIERKFGNAVRVKAFIDSRVYLLSLHANTSNYYFLEDTYDRDGSTTTADIYQVHTVTETYTSGKEAGWDFRIGSGAEIKLGRKATLFGGLRFCFNTSSVNAEWRKDAKYSVRKSSYVPSSFEPVFTSTDLDNGTVDIVSAIYNLALPVGIELKLSENLSAHIGLTYSITQHGVSSVYSGANSTEQAPSRSVRTENMVYYYGLCLHLKSNLALNIFGSLDTLTPENLTNWRVCLAGNL